MKIKIILLVTVIVLGMRESHAQNSETKWGFGLHFGVMEYSGDYDKQFYSFKQGYAVGVSLARYLNPSFDLLGHFFYDQAHAWDEGKSKMPTWLYFRADMYNMNLLVKYKFNNGYLLKENAVLAPFLLAGIGGNYAKDTAGMGENGSIKGQKIFAPNLYAGLGINLRISPAISIGVQTSLMLPFTDKIDGTTGAVAPVSLKGNDKFLENSVSLYITPVPVKRDSDKDGVTDKLDKCPNTPPGVKVDANGCPLDTDKDGVPDYLDKCPDTPPGVKVDADGCPLDTDKDGIPDYQDDCPDVAGLAAFKGCPDSDGDGVPDKDDRCPNTPKGYKVDKFGCPLDSDKDGIPDSEDLCPEKAGVSELKGCPFTVQTIIGKYNLSMKPIYFDFDSYELKPDGVVALDYLSTALTNHRNFGVQLDGHTDYIGTEKYNLLLSEKRANAAKGYLLKKGIVENQIRLQYFGKSKPAMDNRTLEGRRLNRRVEYSLFEIDK